MAAARTTASAGGRAAAAGHSIARVTKRFDPSRIKCFVVGGDPGAAPPKSSGQSRPTEADGAAADLSAALVRRTLDWARDLTGADPDMIELPQDFDRIESAPEEVVLLLRPALVRFSPEQSRDVLDDLQSGCNVVVGPTLAGGWYLLALGGQARGLASSAGNGGPGSAGRLLGAARNIEGVEVGLLRAERDLNGDSDVEAAAADPLVDMEVVRLLAAVSTGGQGFEPR